MKFTKRLLNKKTFYKISWEKILPFIICLIFLAAYSTLGIIKHNHYLSGYDLAVADQAIWKYSHFKNAISTVNNYYTIPLLSDHVELIYILISPIYWIINDVRALIFLQAFIISISGIPIYFLARKKDINKFVSVALLISYLSFYGIQNALWSDVHSLVFAAGFIPWFVYFLEMRKAKLIFTFLILSIICKEDIALLTLLISGVYLFKDKSKDAFISVLVSTIYLLAIFFVYFPHFTNGYLYANPHGMFSDTNILNLVNTKDKQQVIFFSLSWFGWLPLASPIYLIPFVADLAHYFILGNISVVAASTIFLHYRVSLAFLLVWPTIVTISRFKKLNSLYIGIYLLLCCLFFQYYLHSPLSYLSKGWFWQKPVEVKNINKIISQLSTNASVASQSNITPHITHRTETYTLFPNDKNFTDNSPCGNKTCRWLRSGGNPKYLIVDLGSSWDIRHLLINKQNFVSGINNMEKSGAITLIHKEGTSRLYSVNMKL